MKIYTKTGDAGTTSLIGGERVSKADPRVEAYGTVDELAAHLALFCDMIAENSVLAGSGMAEQLIDIQGDLMVVEAMLATGRGGAEKIVPLPDGAIERLEKQIDEMSANLPPVEGFTIPGGHPALSQSHVCRTVCRRAERATIRIPVDYGIDPMSQRYLNRLSDWLYVAGRKIVTLLQIKETFWLP